MKTLNLIQGSPEWLAHRTTAFNASDAPAMMGVSAYKSRSQLIKERATGILPEVDDATQRRFNDGHRFEALARPIAEQIIGDELSPITGVNGKYSASFDGITFDGQLIFEHKTLNAELRACKCAADLNDQYKIQMEHQLFVSGAKECLFMASKFDADGNLVEEVHFYYEPNYELRSRIIAGWEQFEKDVAAYVPQEVKEVAKAEAIKALPSVFVQATGMVTASNLSEFKEAATTFIANINTELVTDQDFADAESTVKFCKEAELNLEATKASVLAQMSTVDEVTRTLDHIAAQLRDKRLMLDKLVKSEKESRKLAIVMSGGTRYAEHLTELKIPVAYMPLMPRVDFGAAVKGLKSLSSMQDKVDALLANTKIEADAVARDINAKLEWCKESSAGFGFLFSDLSALIANNGMEAFQAIVTARIDKHKVDEAAKEEATRLRIRQEEEAKAQAKAKAEQEAIIAKAQAEERAKVEAESKAKLEAEIKEEQATLKKYEKVENLGEDSNPITPITSQIKTELAAPIINTERPSNVRIIEAVMHRFNCSYDTACAWIVECAERLEVTV